MASPKVTKASAFGVSADIRAETDALHAPNQKKLQGIELTGLPETEATSSLMPFGQVSSWNSPGALGVDTGTGTEAAVVVGGAAYEATAQRLMEMGFGARRK